MNVIVYPSAAVCILFLTLVSVIRTVDIKDDPWYSSPAYATLTGTSTLHLDKRVKGSHQSSDKDLEKPKSPKNKKGSHEYREYPEENEAWEWGLPPRLVPQAHAGQCPCIRLQGSASCVAYNLDYQATSLEEAILNFHDLSKPEPQQWDTLNRRLDEVAIT